MGKGDGEGKEGRDLEWDSKSGGDETPELLPECSSSDKDDVTTVMVSTISSYVCSKRSNIRSSDNELSSSNVLRITRIEHPSANKVNHDAIMILIHDYSSWNFSWIIDLECASVNEGKKKKKTPLDHNCGIFKQLCQRVLHVMTSLCQQ